MIFVITWSIFLVLAHAVGMAYRAYVWNGGICRKNGSKLWKAGDVEVWL